MNATLAMLLLDFFLGLVFGFCAALDLDRRANPKRMDVLLRSWNQRIECKRKQADAILASLNKEPTNGK